MKTTKHLAVHLNIVLVGIVCFMLASCKTVNIEPSNKVGYVALPVFPGWIDKHLIHYITTDVNDEVVAKEIGVNYVPRLNEVLPSAGKMPNRYNAVERIYAVTNFKQAKVLPSAPYPIGAKNKDTAYSPLWRMFNVTWVEGVKPYELKSEEEILQAEDKKVVTISPTSLIVNCAVIDDKSGHVMPSARMISKP